MIIQIDTIVNGSMICVTYHEIKDHICDCFC